MRFVADLHMHSKYSRATSQEMELPSLAMWAKRKGIQLLGTGDFTHPEWLRELQEQLRPAGPGLYEYDGVQFMLTTEINNLFYRNDKAKTIHTILCLPTLEAAARVNAALGRYGNLAVDGRPTVNLDARDMVKIVMDVEPRAMVIPAHIWTPWFSLFGAHSGFDSIDECFGDQTEHIAALETGLSSDPAMNWRLSSLDRFSLISNSDAHSPSRIGREANLFNCALDYDVIRDALRTRDTQRFTGTVEFFPEEGKYHYDGHRKCAVRATPAETRAAGGRCRVCGRKLTVGVLHRVEVLADRAEGYAPPQPPTVTHLIPLEEIIADALGVGKQSLKVQRQYLDLIQRLGTEFDILMARSADELAVVCPPRIADGILRVRDERLQVMPGYDGEYGTIQIFGKGEIGASAEQQPQLF